MSVFGSKWNPPCRLWSVSLFKLSLTPLGQNIQYFCYLWRASVHPALWFMSKNLMKYSWQSPISGTKSSTNAFMCQCCSAGWNDEAQISLYINTPAHKGFAETQQCFWRLQWASKVMTMNGNTYSEFIINVRHSQPDNVQLRRPVLWWCCYGQQFNPALFFIAIEMRNLCSNYKQSHKTQQLNQFMTEEKQLNSC